MNKPKLLTQNKKNFALAFTVIFLVIGAYYAGTLQTSQTTIQLFDASKPRGALTVTIIRKNGTVTTYRVHNLVTTIGKKYLRNALYYHNISSYWVGYLAVSNDSSPSASWTKLPNEITGSGLARANATSYSVINNTAYWVYKQWTATATVDVQTGSLHWSPTSNSDNNMWAVASLGSVTTLNSGDKLALNWTVNHA